MKKTIIYAVLFSAIAVTASCRKKGCTDETALNYNAEAKKDDGSCIADPRVQFLGNYSVTDSSFGGGSFLSTEVYTLNVGTGNTKSDTIYLNNWRNTGDNYRAFLAGSTFSVPDNGDPANGHISGSGSFGNNTITYKAQNFSGFETRGKGQK